MAGHFQRSASAMSFPHQQQQYHQQPPQQQPQQPTPQTQPHAMVQSHNYLQLANQLQVPQNGTVPQIQMFNQQQQQQQQQQPPTNPPHHMLTHPNQQVPMTTLMIPTNAASQLQNASFQIQQAAMQAMAHTNGQPHILVFMIPYMMNHQQQPPTQQHPQQLEQQSNNNAHHPHPHQHPHLQQHLSQLPTQLQQQQQLLLPPTIPNTPEQASLNSTLVRHSQSGSSIRSSQRNIQQLNHQPQQQQPQHHMHNTMPTSASHSRAVSSLSTATNNPSKQEQEKFFIKANFSYRGVGQRMELSFQRGEILQVLDTLPNSAYGLFWLATRVKMNDRGDVEKGLIPDKNKAEEIALEQRAMDLSEPGGTLEGLSASVGRVNFLKRRSAQRSKSSGKDSWDNVVFDIGTFKLPVYERVTYKHPGFCRPVVLFGPLADVAREKLLQDYPEKYSYPTGFHQSLDHPRVIRLKGILEVVDQGKHALLDITPSAVEKLNYVNLAPIVIFMKTDSKSIIKEFRSRAAKSLDPNARDEDTLRKDGKSSRKLLEHSIKLEKTWFHVFTATLNLSSMGSEMWYRKLRETIESQQSTNVWMSERKSDKKANNSTNSNGNNSNSNNMTLFQVPSSNQLQTTNTSTSLIDHPNSLSSKFSECLNISNKSTIDLLPNGTYGNRSQLRNAYAHSLAQKLARASSEPKLNGLITDNDEDDDEDEDDEHNVGTQHQSTNNHMHYNHHLIGGDDDDDDDCIKKPFPAEFENSSSVSSSNGGATSYGHSSISGSNLNYQQQQHYPPPQTTQLIKPDQLHESARQQAAHVVQAQAQAESIYSQRNPSLNCNSSSICSNEANNSNGSYPSFPNMASDTAAHHNGYYSQGSLGNLNANNNVIDLSRNHEIRGSAFQVYSDINQNNYHYYNLNKI